MASPLRWLIELTDKLSAPANKASSALGGLGRETDKATQATQKLDAATLKSKVAIANKALEVPRLQQKLERLNAEMRKSEAVTSKSGEGWASKLTAITVSGRAAFDVLRSVGSAAMSTGEALFEAGARQDRTNRAFRNLLGEGGPALQGYLKQIERSTEFTANQLEDLALPLAQQFGVDQIKRILPGVLDVQARGGDARRAAEILSKIGSTGKIEGEAFGALGLKAPEALKTIGSVAGITDPAKVQQAISQGKIGAGQILEGVLLSIARGGKLGDAAVEAATSPAAALNRFRNLSDTIFSRLADSPALPKLAAALDGIVTKLTSDKSIGAFAKSVESFTDALMKVNWETVGTSLVRILERLAKIAPTAANLATFGSLGDEQFDKIKQEGGVRGAVAYIPFVRMLLDDPVQKAVAGIPSANDFIARADGTILRINSQDDLVGYKPGGPIEAAFANGATSSAPQGGGNVVSLSFGDIHVGAGQSRDDFKSAVREVVADIWTGYALEQGAA